MISTPPRLRRSGGRRGRFSKRVKGRFTTPTGTRATGLVRFVRPTYVPRGFGLPERLQNTMMYAEEYSFPASSPAVTYLAYRASSIYGPSFTSYGHQPRYFDQLSQLYGRWVVIGSKFTVTPIYTPGGAVTIVTVTTDDVPTTAQLENVATMQEYPQAHRIDGSHEGTTPNSVQYYSPRKRYGGDVVDRDTLIGTAGANPTDTCFFYATLRCQNAAQQLTGYVFDIKIEYTVIWSNLEPYLPS